MKNIAEITDYLALRAKAEKPFNGILKFQFPEGVVCIDGNEVSNEDVKSDCTLQMKINTFSKVANKKKNPMVAVAFGQIKVKGDVALALRVRDLI